jgi:hypothetical protein
MPGGLDTFLAAVETQIGIDRIVCIHLNDSKTAWNSHKDRHENIGAGDMGSTGLGNWLNHPRLSHLPFILEVPGIEGKGPGKADLDRVRTLINPEAIKQYLFGTNTVSATPRGLAPKECQTAPTCRSNVQSEAKVAFSR